MRPIARLELLSGPCCLNRLRFRVSNCWGYMSTGVVGGGESIGHLVGGGGGEKFGFVAATAMFVGGGDHRGIKVNE